MFIWFIVLVFVSAVACQTAPSIATVTGEPTPTPDGTITPTHLAATSTQASSWVRTDLDGVTVGIRVPAGWQVIDTTSHEGIVLAEQMGTMQMGGQQVGVQVVIFVHETDDLPLSTPTRANVAWAVLNQVLTHRYEYNIGESAAVSQPIGFDWDGYDAAYYLLNDGEGSLKMVLGLAMPDNQLLGCNISAPSHLATRIRRSLPTVLSSLTVNGHRLDSSSLDELPDPLDFPESQPEASAEAS
jgi:hypothetical protein